MPSNTLAARSSSGFIKGLGTNPLNQALHQILRSITWTVWSLLHFGEWAE